MGGRPSGDERFQHQPGRWKATFKRSPVKQLASLPFILKYTLNIKKNPSHKVPNDKSS